MLTRPQTDHVDQNAAPHQRAKGIGELCVVAHNGATKIDRLYQQGCAKIRTPRQSGTALEAIMINSSGGLTGGDKLDWRFEAAEGADLTITTQACERVYKASHDIAKTRVDITVGAHARLAWLPQETIVFDRSALARTITANLAQEAQALFVEPLIFGRRAMGERVEQGSFHDRWRIHHNGKLIHGEDLRLHGDIARQLANTFISNHHEALATVLFISPRAEAMLTPMRNIIGADGAASFWNGKLLARLTAKDGYSARKKLVPIIKLLSFEASVPKVWSL